MPPQVPKVVAAASIAAFALSLTLRGYHCAGVDPMAAPRGWELLTIGWVGLRFGVFAWLGNPLLFFAWWCFFRRKRELAAWFSFSAFLAMLEFLLHQTLVPDGDVAKAAKVVAHGPAYWLWLSSSALMILSSVSALLPREEGRIG